jgi:hypothetical protein
MPTVSSRITLVFGLLLLVAQGLRAQVTGDAQPTAGDPSPPPLMRPIATRQTTFAIPFSFQQGGEPQEVRLFVSTDQGANWVLYARERPAAGQFLFRAARDGECWFAVRTIDATGRPHPEGPPQPELKVLVDTVPPKLDFHAGVGQAGEVTASWHVADSHLVANSLRIEFQASVASGVSEPPWQEVAIERPRDAARQITLDGQTTWWPDRSGPSLRVRASVRDEAGNLTEVNRRVFLPRVVAQPAAADRPEFTPPQDPFRRRSETVPPAAGPADTANVPPAPTSPPSDEPTATGPFGSFAQYRRGAAEPTLGDPRRDEDIAGPRHWSDLLPDGERLRMTNSRQWELEYDIDSVGPSGVAKVELWGTRDGGQSWENWGADTDNKSPFRVEVKHEGVYGFRVAITSGIGFTSPPPQPGDVADLWVGVDQTKPLAEITSVPLGSGPHAGQLIIHWTAHDQHLAERPIALLFAEHPNGPWETIATDLPNSGTFNWRVAPTSAQEIYLRIEVRDEAGNVAVHQTADPINIAGLHPRGRIKGFQAPH